jgi:hypothetical protein
MKMTVKVSDGCLDTKRSSLLESIPPRSAENNKLQAAISWEYPNQFHPCSLLEAQF